MGEKNLVSIKEKTKKMKINMLYEVLELIKIFLKTCQTTVILLN